MKKGTDRIIGVVLSAAACVLVLSILLGGFGTTKYTGTGTAAVESSDAGRETAELENDDNNQNSPAMENDDEEQASAAMETNEDADLAAPESNADDQNFEDEELEDKEDPLPAVAENNPSDQISPAVAQNNIYHPEESTVAYDSEAHVRYYNNLLFVILHRELTDEEADALAAQVGGQVVGSRSGSLKFLQIMVEESSLDQLQADADKLMESEDVLYATYDSPIEMEANESDWSGWDHGNEDDPSGMDWWAEAVGAYSAWEYSNQAKPIKVCVVDNYFDTNHPELSGKVTMLNENSIRDGDDSHGTHVAGLIAAKHNGEGIRGIADRAELLLIDWTQKDKDLLGNGEYLDILSTALEQGAKVINMSFGQIYLNEKKFKKLKQGRSYEDYSDEIIQKCRNTAILSMEWMLAEYEAGYSDYLLVQSAGNGKDGDSDGIGANFNGFFSSITGVTYNLFLEKMGKEGVEKRYKTEKRYLDNIDLDFFLDRIIIVGAVKNSRVGDDKDNKNTYEFAKFSNYGDRVDICAPGQNIYSTAFDDTYKIKSGTSQAAPIVSGAAALIWSMNPALTAPEVKQILLSNTTTRAYRKEDASGYPMLNVADAVSRTLQTLQVDTDGILQEYLKDFLIPEYGLFSENFKSYDNAFRATKLTKNSGRVKIDGILFAYIYDYDEDGVSELLVQRYEEQKGGDTKLLLEMYEANCDTAMLGAILADRVSYSTSRFDGVEYDVRTALFMSRQEKTDHPVINLYVSLSNPAGELDDDYAAFKDSTFNSDSVMKNALVNPNYNYESMRFFIYSGGMFVQDGEYFETQESQSFFWTSDLQLQTSDELAVISKEVGGDTRVDGAALVEQDSEAAYKSREQHSLIGYLARFDDYGAGRGLNYNRFYIELDDYTSADKYYVKDLFKENNEIVWFSEMDVRLEKQDGPGKAVYINDYSKLNMINTWRILFESEKAEPETEQPAATPATTEVPEEPSSQTLLAGSLNIEIQTLTPTTQISIQYPVVTGADTATVLALNQRFLTEAQELADAEVSELSSMGDGVSFTRTIENAYVSSPVISFTIRDYAYYGGSHGIPGAKGFSYDLLQDKELSMGELLGCTDEVAREAAVLAFSRTDLGTSGTVSAETFRERMDEATFWLGEDGVHVMFQINTMGAYSLGMPEAVVLQSDVEAAGS